jgi:hypothetical protein
MMKHMGHLIPSAPFKPKRHIWSRFGTSADVEQVAEPAAVGDVPLTTQHTSTRRKNPWTRTHSHFALMGGFAFETDDSQADFLPDPYTRLTLTPRALRKLAEVEPMLIPDLSERAIKDKSKASWLAKTLACLQACWFIVQVIGRAATSAPISLLEMNTFLHALCCLIIYLAWWYKPLDIEEPELIKTDSEKIRKICAWMIMSSQEGAVRLLEPELDKRRVHAFLVHRKDLWKSDNEHKVHTKGALVPAYGDFDKDDLIESERTSYNGTHSEVQDMGSVSASRNLRHGQIVNGFYLIRIQGTQRIQGIPYSNANVTLDPATLECLRLADSLRTDPESGNMWRFDWSLPETRPASITVVLPYISNLDDLDDVTLRSTALTKYMSAERFLWIMLMLAGSIYGLVHLIAWNGPFTSLVQRWMWRGSCLIIVSPTIIVMIGYLSLILYDALGWGIYRRKFPDIVLLSQYYLQVNINRFFPSGSAQWIIFVGCMFALLVLTYLAARVFLLVECFINLSQLPPEVYQVPQWAQYIPHLGGG